MRTFPAIALTVSLAACAVSYTPSPDRPFEAIPEFNSTNRVSLRNGRPDTAEVRMTRWYVNRNAWTDVAIAITRRELTARGLTVADGEARSLELAIESASTESGWVKITSEIVLRVRTGDGYTAMFTGRNSAAMAAHLERQVDGAMMRAVVAMLSDPKIVSYLTQ